MIDLDDLQTLRRWQAKNRKRLYLYGGTFVLMLLIANLIPIFGG